MKTRLFFFAFFALIAIACARIEERRNANQTLSNPGSGKFTAGDLVQSIVVSGQTRSFRLHIPPSYQQGKLTALVINIHGLSSNAEQQERISKMAQKSDAAGFIAVHPEGTGNPQDWNFGPGEKGQAELEFFRDLIRTLESQLLIDSNRVYATGISNGAQMTNRLGCAMSDTFAAIAPVSGGYFRGEQCPISRPVSVVAFHGTADNLLPYDGRPPLMISIPQWASDWATRNGCGAAPKVTFQKGQVTGETWSGCKNNAVVVLYTVKDGGHSWPGSDLMPRNFTTQDIDATDTIWNFLAAHPKP